MPVLVASAAALGAQQSPRSGEQIATAPASVNWIAVRAGELKAKLPQLTGKYIEVQGGLRTLMGVRRDNSFTNAGWVVDSAEKEVGSVLFDQSSDDAIAFMAAQRCHATCTGVFIRGVVVKKGSGSPLLRLIEASHEPRSGMQTPAMKALAALPAADPGAAKPLLPAGAVPTREGGLPGAGPAPVQQSAAPAETTGAKKLFGRLKSAGIVKTAEKKDESASKGRVDFHFGDAPVRQTAYRNVRDTELHQLFKDYHWNTGRTMWPRVALIVEEQPTGHTASFANPNWGSDVRNGCWKIRAKLWMAHEASKEIAPFNWCLSEATYDSIRVSATTMAYGLAHEGVALWGTSPKTMFSDQNTGPQRTTGPKPPATATPRFYYRMDTNADAIMLGNILRDMAFSYGVADGRVWVIDPPQPDRD